MNGIDSHQDQQLESDLNIKDQFRNVCFRERFENVLYSIRFQSLPGLYDPTTGLGSGRLVNHLGLARCATQQLKD